MSKKNVEKQQVEDEMDDVIRRRVYGNGVSSMNEELRTKMMEILSACKDMTIATVRPDGWPQANTVGFVNIGEDIYVETFKTASKTKNIEHDPRVSITMSPFYENVGNACGISMAAYAEKVTDEAVMVEFHRLLLEKMPELGGISYNDGEKVFPDPNTVLFRFRPTIISLLDFSKGFGHADLVLIDNNTSQ